MSIGQKPDRSMVRYVDVWTHRDKKVRRMVMLVRRAQPAAAYRIGVVVGNNDQRLAVCILTSIAITSQDNDNDDGRDPIKPPCRRDEKRSHEPSGNHDLGTVMSSAPSCSSDSPRPRQKCRALPCFQQLSARKAATQQHSRSKLLSPSHSRLRIDRPVS
jgi:hypothetical protein